MLSSYGRPARASPARVDFDWVCSEICPTRHCAGAAIGAADARCQNRERDYKPVGFSPRSTWIQQSTDQLRGALADSGKLSEPVDAQ